MRSPTVSACVSTLRPASSRRIAGEKKGPIVCEAVRRNVVGELGVLIFISLLSALAQRTCLVAHAQQYPSDSPVPTLARSGYGHRWRSMPCVLPLLELNS